MSDKETICAKVEPPLKEQIDQYAEDHGMKRSPAMRDLMKTGLDGGQGRRYLLTTPLLLFGTFVLGTAVEPGTTSEFLFITAALAFVTAVGLEVWNR